MIEHQDDSVIQRLDRLERENWYWKKMAGALFILLTVFTTVALIRGVKPIQTDEVLTVNEIRTRRLIVMDGEGKSRIKLGQTEIKLGPTGYGKLVGDDYGLTLLNSEGFTGAKLFVEPGFRARSALYLYDHLGDYHAGLSVESGNDPNESGNDPNYDGLQVELKLLGKRLRNFQEAKQSITLSVYSKLASDYPDEHFLNSSTFITMKGKPHLVLGDDSNYYPGLVLGHTRLQTKNGVIEQRPASSLVLFNKDGNVLWKTP
jgi:hypothetical protein